MKKTYLFALATRFKFKQNTITIYKYRYKGNICNDICPCSYNLFKLERLAPTIYIYIYICNMDRCFGVPEKSSIEH